MSILANTWLARLRGREDELAQMGAEWADLRAADEGRISRMEMYRQENQRARDPDIELKTADLADYGRMQRDQQPQRHNIPIPLGMSMTVKHAFRISGRLPDVIVDRRDESPQERHRSDTIEKIVWATIRESEGDTQIADGAWDSSQLGAACFDIYFDVKKQIPKFRAIDPTGVLVVPGVEDPHDFQRVYRSWTTPTKSLQAQYRAKMVRGLDVSVGDITHDHMDGLTQMTTVVHCCDGHKSVTFLPGCNVLLYEYIHDYGFVPYTVIPNLGPYRDVWGWADYELVRPLLHYMTANLSREADIIRAVANGTYIEKGTGQNADHIQKTLRTGGTIPSRKDGSLEPVNVPDIPQFAENHGERVMELFKMLGFTPDAAWGKPGSSSGSDRGLSLQPLLELTAMKQLNWQKGLAKLFGHGLQMIEQKMSVGTKYRGSKNGVGPHRKPFQMELGPNVDPLQVPNPDSQPTDPMGGMDGMPEFIDLPRTPKELFDGDYSVRFLWQNRIDPDDPSFILSEINKFQAGAQSLRTTLERLGFQAPEDEMNQIEQEAQRFPWINQGMVSLVMAQLKQNQQGEGGGGSQQDLGGALGGALATMQGGGGGGSGALDQDALASTTGAPGQLYGGA